MFGFGCQITYEEANQGQNANTCKQMKGCTLWNISNPFIVMNEEKKNVQCSWTSDKYKIL